MSSRTPTFLFETPTSECGSSSERGSCRGVRSARELLRHIVPPKAEDASVDTPSNTHMGLKDQTRVGAQGI